MSLDHSVIMASHQMMTPPGHASAHAAFSAQTSGLCRSAALRLAAQHLHRSEFVPSRGPTNHEAEAVRLQVLLCTMARSLVMWDSVAPTEAWIQAQLPTLLKVPTTAHATVLLAALVARTRTAAP